MLGLLPALLAADSAAPTPVEQRDQPWRISSFAPDAGLARQNIFNFDFEPDGTMWVAASVGLLRYDGYTWQRFGSENGLPSNFVRSVRVSRNGEIWVGTDKGAGTFDGRAFDRKGSDTGLAGPSVRRIVEDPDGTIWFCSDRWPDSGVISGIASFQNGTWTAYTMKDGLVGDHIYNYFRDREGRQFVMTQTGVSQRFGDRWGSPEGGGALGSTECWDMAETPDLGLVARASDGMFVRQADSWRRVAVPTSRHAGRGPALAVTREGEIVTCDFNGTRFGIFRWQGTDIEPVSPLVEGRDFNAEFIREAPDGSVWFCGNRVLSRWERSGGEWAEYSSLLPLPRLIDRQGRIWFVDPAHESMYRSDADGLKRIPGPKGFIALDNQGNVWAWNATEIILHRDEPVRFGIGQTGLRRVRNHTLDARGRSWFDGEDAQGNPAAAIFDGTTWTKVPLQELHHRTIVDVAADPVAGVWYLASEPQSPQVTCLHAGGPSKTTLTTQYRITRGEMHLSIDPTGTLWLSGQAAMYRFEPNGDRTWRRVTAIRGNTASKGLVRGDEIWFRYSWDGRDPGYAAYRAGNWRFFSGSDSYLLATATDGTLYLGTEQGINILAPDANAAPSQLTLPAVQRIDTLAKGRGGDMWLGAVDPNVRTSAWHYRADRVPPKSTMTVPDEVRRDRQLLVEVSAVERFVPRGALRVFQYSWRFDDGVWSEFQPIPTHGIPVSSLDSGVHRLQLRARDEGGDIEAAPVERTFVVRPIPLQERSWFKPAVLAVFAIILALAIFAAERARRFALANVLLQQAHERLEERVAKRTAELSKSNERLAVEVAERKRAQDELGATQERLLETSRLAGMAEVATNVLHNVGNVLNSVNVAATVVSDRVRSSDAASCLEKLSSLLQEQSADVRDFIANDPRGRRIPEFMARIVEALIAERKVTLDELEQLRGHVEHIKQIVAMQQSYAKVSGVTETVAITEIVEDALRINAAALERESVRILRAYEADPVLTVERHKVIQILVNVIGNAKHACADAGRVDRQIVVRIAADTETVVISVTDNGIGIAAENLTRIFGHGFTTRKSGHGFGLHSGALTASELGGSLTATSAGVGHGATLTLRLPLRVQGSRPPHDIPAQVEA